MAPWHRDAFVVDLSITLHVITLMSTSFVTPTEVIFYFSPTITEGCVGCDNITTIFIHFGATPIHT